MLGLEFANMFSLSCPSREVVSTLETRSSVITTGMEYLSAVCYSRTSENLKSVGSTLEFGMLSEALLSDWISLSETI